ncbi:mediator complex subunit 13 C-terminal-domain-containing protein [Dactylonectria macrodidyma]|uniref:Mediator of RNA polymerase II transcription subunit 13 n=1 Tax=Dactylonectria macrodidyma TaxID=307937 RepID=A0A9P9JMP9_9HYPO|nr:mediator complex subunit 13 C-terminal-domain-containing protein [Dactylonectria macrodidyma]
MDTGEYETNSLVINNVASITFQVYEPSSDQSQSFHLAALEVEGALRDQGHIVAYDSNRRGIWVFQIKSKDDAKATVTRIPDATLEACGHTLAMGEEGSFEPIHLQKNCAVAKVVHNASASAGPALESQRSSLSLSQSSMAPGQDGDTRVATAMTDDTKRQAALKTIYEHFIAAILSAISFAFCSESLAIPLNYRTVLIPPPPPSHQTDDAYSTKKDPFLGTFRTYLTTTGSLVITLYLSQCNSLSSLEDVMAANLMPPNRPILAAPFGVFAAKQGFGNGDNGTGLDTGLAQTPNTQALSFRGLPDSQDSVWKQKCLRALELCGLDSSPLKALCWVNLMLSKSSSQDAENEVGRSHSLVPWPGSLCFRKKPVEISATCRVGDNVLSGHEECHDPLGTARGWFSTTTERDERVAKRKAARRATARRESNGNEPRVQKSNGQSPLALQRPNATAAGVMYPTPPDAIQQHLGVASSLDGNISSPGNPPPTVAVIDMDSAMSNTHPTSDAFQDGWGATNEPKRDQNDGNMLSDSDNVFGDIGGDMFGDHDVTEDDFDFFDQQPDNVDLDLSMRDLDTGPLPSVPQVAPPIPRVDPEPAKVTEKPTQRPKIEVDDAVFAKPELKHARSSLNDEVRQRGRTERPGSAKRESSPFDPDTVFKRVRASLMGSSDDQNLPALSRRKSSIFQKVDFDPKLPMINKKYEQGGTYDFTTDRTTTKLNRDTGIPPEKEYLERHGKLSQRPKELPPPAGSLMKTFAGIEVPVSHPSPIRPDTSASGGDDSGIESDGDESSSVIDGPASPIKSSVKRIMLDEDAISQATSLRDGDISDEAPDEQLAIELPRMSKSEPPEISLCRFFSDPEPLSLELGLPDEDFIQIAQLITEQAATGSIEIGKDQRSESKAALTTLKNHEITVARSSLQVLQNIVPSSLGGVAPVRLKGYLDVLDVPLSGQPNRLQARPMPGRERNPEQMRANSLYQIPGPHLEVRRSDTKLSVLPSAVTFWASLGLAPSSGSKHVSALCVFPGWKGMADHARTFLSRLKSMYESLKLGTFSNMQLSGESDGGILQYEVDRISTSPDAAITGHGSALFESMEILRSSLSEWTAKEKNLVIYFVYSPDNPRSIVEACSAFQRCFNMYRKTLASRRETPQNELVLQLVPSEMLSSTTALVVSPPQELIRLCMETYDRCTLFLSPEFGGPTPAPAIMLEQPLPRIIDFKLLNAPSGSLMHENSCIHVAYAQSIDGRWVTAAWTDNRGQLQASASYCLGRKGKAPSTSMNEVAHEIWESTLDLISIWKVHWRCIITKSGPMDVAEMEFWVDLARTESKASVAMILMTVDTNPSLQLIPPHVKIPHTSTSAFYSTPVSTPQPSILSPEQINTPATPMRDANAAVATPGADSAGEADSDTFLIDGTDQTWGAVVGHRLSNSTTLLEVRPALVSGYLIKRTGNKVEEPPIVMEVNLIHTEASARAYEPLLREMLSYFRGLGTLARARGIVDRELDVRPWHIAVVEKGVRALYLLL